MESPPRRRWQFTIRGMLLFTAIVSSMLCFAVKLPLLFQITLVVIAIGCFLSAILWTANFATSDRRPWLAILSWSAFGSFFLFFAAAALLSTVNSLARGYGLDYMAAGLFGVMGICSVICGFGAVRAFAAAAQRAACRRRHA